VSTRPCSTTRTRRPPTWMLNASTCVQGTGRRRPVNRTPSAVTELPGNKMARFVTTSARRKPSAEVGNKPWASAAPNTTSSATSMMARAAKRHLGRVTERNCKGAGSIGTKPGCQPHGRLNSEIVASGGALHATPAAPWLLRWTTRPVAGTSGAGPTRTRWRQCVGDERRRGTARRVENTRSQRIRGGAALGRRADVST